MVEPSIFQLLTERALLTSNDVVLDIGAGLGFLTRFLAEKCEKVLAVELDSKLVKVLRKNLRNLSNVEVFEGDIFKVPTLQFTKIVSIPPYNISSDLFKWLFDKSFACAVLVFQKEFANRVVASVGSEYYGWLAVLAYYHFEVELFEEVPKWMFYPPPEVDSKILRLTPRTSPPFYVKNYTLFKRLVQLFFTQRNRKVRNSVQPLIRKRYTSAKDAVRIADSLPFHNRRVRELAPEDFGEVANVLAS